MPWLLAPAELEADPACTPPLQRDWNALPALLQQNNGGNDEPPSLLPATETFNACDTLATCTAHTPHLTLKPSGPRSAQRLDKLLEHNSTQARHAQEDGTPFREL